MKEKSNVFDYETIHKKQVFLKGVGRYCSREACGRHIVPKKKSSVEKQRYCTKSCQMKAYRERHDTKSKNILLANVNIKEKLLHVYLKKGVKEVFLITPEYKELYEFLCKVEQFRGNYSQPFEVLINV